MSLARVLGRASRTAAATAAHCRSLFFHCPPPPPQHHLSSLLSNRFHSLSNFRTEASAVHNGLRSTFSFSHCGMSTSASPEKEQQASVENKEATGNAETATADASSSEQAQQTGSTSESPSASQSVKRRRRGTKRTAFSDSDSEGGLDDLSKDDLVKLVAEKEKVLEQKEKEFSEWKDKFLRSYAEMENVMERTRRDAENSKKFAVQSFAKSLFDVADNLGRAASVTKESFTKIDASNDTVGAVPLLKTLLEGVEMTEKQLAEVFRKSGIEKYDPINEQFDPNRHNAVFQVPDNSKPPGTIAVVIKAGYTLHDRIIRPAEVGVTVAVENNESNS